MFKRKKLEKMPIARHHWSTSQLKQLFGSNMTRCPSAPIPHRNKKLAHVVD